MTLALYMDHHVPQVITNGLRLRGVDVLTAYEDGREEAEDPDLLDRATNLQRVLFTQDDDFLDEATNRQRGGEIFFGLVFAQQRHVSLGTCVHDLELIAKGCDPQEMENRIWFLPIQDAIHLTAQASYAYPTSVLNTNHMSHNSMETISTRTLGWAYCSDLWRWFFTQLCGGY